MHTPPALAVPALPLVRRCLERGHDLQCPHLTAFARLGLAKFALQHTVEASDAAVRGCDGVIGFMILGFLWFWGLGFLVKGLM
jgi:hypothetical protein